MVRLEREIVDDLSKEAVAFRSTRLVDFNRADVTSLDGAFGKTTFALSQKDGGWSAGGQAILAGAGDDVESAILDAQSKGYLDDADAKALTSPVATVTVKTKAPPPWVVTLYARDGGAAAKVSGRPGAFAVDPALAGTLETAFQKAMSPPPTAAPTKPAQVSRARARCVPPPWSSTTWLTSSSSSTPRRAPTALRAWPVARACARRSRSR